ncbi:MAG: hypothetical protein V4718_08920 [Pseudomonadota bacterium]
MTTILNAKRAGLVAATLAVAAFGFAGAAQARDNVSFSVGIGVPGVQVGVTNAYPVYQQPVYVQPAPVYVQPRPVYVPRPVYYGPQPVYYAPQPVYVRPGRHHGHGHKHGGHYVQAPRSGYYAPGYAPVYYPR